MRIGIVGCGKQGVRGHGQGFLALRELGVEVVGAADPTPARREIAREELGLSGEQVHADPFELIARPDVEAVSITTPQRFHPELVLAAAECRKHVLCEKPIATAPADAARMVEACRQAGVTLAMVHNYLWMDDGVKALLREGAIGRPVVVTLNALGVIDYPGVGEYRPTWRHTLAEAGGGVLTDMLHYVYLVEWLLDAPIGAVSASVDRRLSSDQDVEDMALCRFEHVDKAGRAVGRSIVNVAWGEGPGGIDVMGERGRLRVHYQGNGTMPFVPAERIEIDGPDGSRSIPADGARQGRLVYRDFVEAVRDGRPPAATGEDGLRCLEAVVAVYASAALGRELRLPLERGSPLFARGAAGIGELELPAGSRVRELGLFGATAR